MTRALSTLTQSASQNAVVRPIILAALDFSSGMVRVNDTPFDITIEENTYYGLGQLGGISSVQEGAELQSYNIEMTLSGIPPELISLALLDHYQGRDVDISLVLLDEEHIMIGDPTLLFRGRMDTMTISLGEKAIITVVAQNRMADWDRARIRRYTHEDQIIDYPDDKGLEFITQMAEKTIYWGR